MKEELDKVIADLESKGVTYSSDQLNITGLGDFVESTLKTFGITEERFKEWFNLNECNCTKRKKWLNNLFSWKKRQANG
jgi:hypothetical protein